MTTPMSIIKPWFKEIEKQILARNPSAQILNLCRTKHSEPVVDKFEKRPVNCDFIRVYHSDDSRYTFGIEFDYLNKESKDWALRFSIGTRKLEKEPGDNHYRYEVKNFDWMPFKSFNSQVAQKTKFEGNTVDELCKYLTGQVLTA